MRAVSVVAQSQPRVLGHVSPQPGGPLTIGGAGRAANAERVANLETGLAAVREEVARLRAELDLLRAELRELRAVLE